MRETNQEYDHDLEFQQLQHNNIPNSVSYKISCKKNEVWTLCEKVLKKPKKP